MGLFSFGGSKSKSQSESSSLDYGANASSSFSDSLSSAISGGSSSQSIAFEDIFKQLYGGATGAAGRAAGLAPLLEGQAASLFSSGNRFLEGLEGGAGRDYLEGRVSGENPLVDEQIAALGGDLGKFFKEQINPEIALKGIAGGTLGGGRQGVAQGFATDALAREFQRGATGIRTADMTARDSAARDLSALDIQAAGTGLGSLGSLFGIAEGGANAGLSPYAALSQILGGPTVLGESSQFSESQSVAQAISKALGFSYGTSKATSKGKASSLNFGFG